MKPLEIFVTAVEPGMFRTDWAGRSMVRTERQIADYDVIFDPIREARKARSGQQPGDPAKAGKVIADFLEVPNPPPHLLLVPDAFDYVDKEMEALRPEFAEWEDRHKIDQLRRAWIVLLGWVVGDAPQQRRSLRLGRPNCV